METVTADRTRGKRDLELIAAECLDLLDLAEEMRRGRLTRLAQRLERKIRIVQGAVERVGN